MKTLCTSILLSMPLLVFSQDPNIYELIYAQSEDLSPAQLSGCKLDTVVYENMFDCFPCAAYTPLQHAVAKKNHRLIKLLLDMGADPNFGFDTPLHFAANNNDLPSAEMLSAHGAEIDRISSLQMTPLLVAAKWSSPDVLQFLIDKGADWKAKDEFGDNALQISDKCCGDGMGGSILPENREKTRKILIELGLE